MPPFFELIDEVGAGARNARGKWTMALAETQALLARLLRTKNCAREFFEAPVAVATRFRLERADTQRLAALDRCETEAFARSLIGKRALYARKALPLTARAWAIEFDALLWEAIAGARATESHRADAAALVALLERRIAQRDLAASLDRRSRAFRTCVRRGGAFRRDAIFSAIRLRRRLNRNSLAKDEDVSAIRRSAVGVWARLPRGGCAGDSSRARLRRLRSRRPWRNRPGE